MKNPGPHLAIRGFISLSENSVFIYPRPASTFSTAATICTGGTAAMQR